jgi:hypothetical protein
LGCEVIVVHGRVAETEGNMTLRHGVMTPTISVGHFSTHSLRSIAIKVLMIKQRVSTSKITDWQIKNGFICL